MKNLVVQSRGENRDKGRGKGQEYGGTASERMVWVKKSARDSWSGRGRERASPGVVKKTILDRLAMQEDGPRGMQK